MNLPPFLTDPPKPTHPAIRYGFLSFCVGLLIWHIIWVSHMHWRLIDNRTRVIGFVVVALLLNHLAFRFVWSRGTMIALRAVASLWLVVLVAVWLQAAYR